MENLGFKIDVVLNECSELLNNIEKEESNKSLFYETLFKNFINGSLLQFVRSIQSFLETSECKNVYMIYVCLSQIRKCILMHKTTIAECKAVVNFEKVLITYLIKRIQKCFFKLEDFFETDLNNVDEYPGVFIDQMNIILNGLNNREDFELIKPNIEKILFQAITIAKVSDEVDNLEITSTSKFVLKTVQQFENMDIKENDSFFQFDNLSTSLCILERRINTAVLNLISKIFNDPFCTVKKLIKMCGNSVDIQFRNSSDLSSMVLDLDKSTDALIQIGLFSVACCKNDEYVIPLKCCISSLELLDSDMIPALIEFYLSPKSLQKKTFLKLLINHWICEISEMQSLINKIIDPFAFAQTITETSMDIIEKICRCDSKINADLYVHLLNGFVNFNKYIEQIFETEIIKKDEFSRTYEQFKNALKEYKACLIFSQNINISFKDDPTRTKLIKRCEIVIKYLKNIQVIIFNDMESKNTSQLDTSRYILSKTKQPSECFQPVDNLDNYDNLDLMLSNLHVQKSFYGQSERKSLKVLYNQNDCSINDKETTYGYTVIMDLTNILDNLIDTFTTNGLHKTSVNIWKEFDVNTHTNVQDFEDFGHKIKSVG